MTRKTTSRRSALQKITGTAVLASVSSLSYCAQASEDDKAAPLKLKGNINHSVCKWCYRDIPLDEFCADVKKMGIQSVEIVSPETFPTLKKYGLTCAMATGDGISISDGFNDPNQHERLLGVYQKLIPQVAEAGFDTIICFSGNRRGMDDQEGLENCVTGLKPVMKIAEENNVNVMMELLNSKVNHPDYMCDHTPWGVELCKKLGSDRFKLLYDIYHMQIMEGDIIATIRDYNQYFGHYHTGGVPGRAEIDETQELYYPAIMQAILDTGYKGFVGQEFVPKGPNPLKSLQEGVEICDI